MPEISLQAYENEINQLNEQARYLEALAHVRHILAQYPHYVGAYFLLGETMLEVGLPGLAADMFRRALSANPEHLMARTGLGLAHERADNLDASIWNLHRALELDPGNSEIVDELRRLYERREGLELDYMPQTPAGLARLYIKGNRNGRAVTQLRALLDEEPARPDLMTALAEAYWRNEQIVQASDMCQDILDKMPHNCKANLLLGTLWVNGGQEEGWAYLQRAQEVDPENTTAEALFGSKSLLAPQSLNLDRLVYDPDAIEVDQESAWFKQLQTASVTLGISEAPPEMTESEMRLVDITAGLESQIEIPDWLRELGPSGDEAEAGGLGWMADLGAAAAPEVSEDLGPVEGGVFGELDDALPLQEPRGEPELFGREAEDASPDWLQELTTQEMSFDLDESEGPPDWLAELVGDEDGAEGTPQAVVGTGSEDSSGRSADLPAEEDAGDLGVLTGEAVSGEEADWLAGLSTHDETDAGALDWLGGLQSAVAEDSVAGLAEATTDEIDVSELGDVPDWLKALDVEPAADDETGELTIPAPEGVEAEIPPADAATWADEVPDERSEMLSGDDALAWLQSLTAGKEEELRAQAGADSEARVPEILGREPAESSPVPVGEPAQEPADDAELVPDEVETEVAEEADVVAPAAADVEIAPLREEDEPLSGDDALAWLEGLAADKEEELREQAEVPETVLEAPDMEEPAFDTAVETVVGEPPEEESDLLSRDDAVAWLESLTAGREDELRAQAEAESEARVTEGLGLKPAVREPGPPATMIEMPADEDVEAPAGQGDLVPGDDELAWLHSLSAGEGDEPRGPAETAPVEPDPEEAEPAIAELPGAAAEAPDVVGEEGLGAGDDAIAWLSELTPEKASELAAQLESESEAAVPGQEGEGGYFGWSAFSGRPEEVPVPSAALEAVPAAEPALPDLPAVEPATATTEPVEAVAPPAEVAAPIAEEPAVVEEPVMEAEVPPSEVPVAAPVAEPAETAAPPVEEDVSASTEMRPEAEPSAVTAEDLDEMRAYAKRKRSDHAARLSLARALWHAGEIQESMEHYGRLIKAGARSDEVMVDLEQYVASGPSSASVTRTFGDAHMKNGDLGKALEIYNRAMELL